MRVQAECLHGKAPGNRLRETGSRFFGWKRAWISRVVSLGNRAPPFRLKAGPDFPSGPFWKLSAAFSAGNGSGLPWLALWSIFRETERRFFGWKRVRVSRIGPLGKQAPISRSKNGSRFPPARGEICSYPGQTARDRHVSLCANAGI